jgi:hypothetical protein
MLPDIDFRAMFIALVLAGAAAGAALVLALPWLWSLVKPLLHAVTAV